MPTKFNNYHQNCWNASKFVFGSDGKPGNIFLSDLENLENTRNLIAKNEWPP